MSDTQITTSTELRLLQALRLKGRLKPDAVPAVVGAEAADLLPLLVDSGFVRPGAAGAKLSGAGKERLAALLGAERETLDSSTVAGLYELFEAPNNALKAAVSAWQLRPDGTPNDHTDSAYDAGVVDRLRVLSVEAIPLAEAIAGAVPRLGIYPVRLRGALERVTAGEHTYVAHPMVDSFHQVWFELHEELIGLLGLSRADEAKKGRA